MSSADNATQSPAFAMQTSRKPSQSNIVQELRDFLAASDNTSFASDFKESFNKALNSGIREFEDFSIKTFDDYIDWYEYLLGWVPSEQQDGQFVYRVLCLFYFVMNFPPLLNRTSPILPTTHSPYTWLSQWVVRYAKEIGKFMDTPDSITPYTIATFRNSPSYNMDDYPVPEGGWKTFNEFFARKVDPEKRHIQDPDSNLTITSPADSVFDGSWDVDGSAQITVKNVPWPITELLDDAHSPNGQNYGSTFGGGQFCHAFLGPHDYHRQHAPVNGKVIEARVIEGLCYLEVGTKPDANGRLILAPRRRIQSQDQPDPIPTGANLDAPDSTGYQFIQARALILIETKDIGLVAVLPIGMAQVSSVVLSVKAGDEVKKGQEISYFQFGGSDIVMVFQKKANVQFTAIEGEHYNVGMPVAKASAAK
ncbi:hypothetical protein K474DRAFT_1710710 [Panus rudis PR-1116 ss-1]|nr:hypothetical protein K474DRAFT_1710710 [Panus rudis PR-1116 ss-1]